MIDAQVLALAAQMGMGSIHAARVPADASSAGRAAMLDNLSNLAKRTANVQRRARRTAPGSGRGAPKCNQGGCAPHLLAAFGHSDKKSFKHSFKIKTPDLKTPEKSSRQAKVNQGFFAQKI
jgi:hypothetical protein